MGGGCFLNGARYLTTPKTFVWRVNPDVRGGLRWLSGEGKNMIFSSSHKVGEIWMKKYIFEFRKENIFEVKKGCVFSGGR